MSSLCLSCIGANCLQQPPQNNALYNIQDNQIFYSPDFSIIPPCPPGYRCNRTPPPVIIPARRLPPVIPQNGRIRLDCCQFPLFATIPPGAPASQVNAIIANLFAQCAAQQAACDTINNPTDPPVPNPPGPPGRGQNPQHVCNTQQCATVDCAAPGQSITRCIDAGTFCVDVSDGSAASLNEAQGIVNAQAHADAVAAAQRDAIAGCNYCNDPQSGSSFCPSNPGLNSHVTIPACTYISADAADVPSLNNQAMRDMINALNAAQILLGCPCPGPTMTITTISSGGGPGQCLAPPGPIQSASICDVCDTTYAWNLASPTPVKIGPTGFPCMDINVQFCAQNGFNIGYPAVSVLTPITATRPTITFNIFKLP